MSASTRKIVIPAGGTFRMPLGGTFIFFDRFIADGGPVGQLRAVATSQARTPQGPGGSSQYDWGIVSLGDYFEAEPGHAFTLLELENLDPSNDATIRLRFGFGRYERPARGIITTEPPWDDVLYAATLSLGGGSFTSIYPASNFERRAAVKVLLSTPSSNSDDVTLHAVSGGSIAASIPPGTRPIDFGPLNAGLFASAAGGTTYLHVLMLAASELASPWDLEQ